jgi:hypothetical protein
MVRFIPSSPCICYPSAPILIDLISAGMNIVLFGSYLFITRYKRKHARVGRRIMVTAIFMFLFSTTHVSLGFQRLIEGFIVLRNQPGGPAAFFSNVSIPANVAKVCIHTINVSNLSAKEIVRKANCSVANNRSQFWETVLSYVKCDNLGRPVD